MSRRENMRTAAERAAFDLGYRAGLNGNVPEHTYVAGPQHAWEAGQVEGDLELEKLEERRNDGR